MANTLEFVSHLDASPDAVWEAVEKPALFLHVAAPMVQFAPIGLPHFPERWSAAEYRGAMKLFGLVPLGWQAIVISFPQAQGNMRVLEDNGYSPLLPKWSHRIEVSPEGTGTRYVDRLCFDAGWMTPFSAIGIGLFFKHRQRRLQQLARDNFADLDG